MWEGLTREEVQARYPELFSARFRDNINDRVPGGELPGEVAERLAEFVQALRLLIATLLGMPLEKSYCLRMDNLGISHLSFKPQRGHCHWQAHYINSTAHLLA